MKAIKINSEINLTSGLQIQAGGIAIIASGTANVSGVQDGKIPCQVLTSVYASLSDYNAGKASVPQETVQDFNSNFTNLQLSIAGYETLPTQDLLIGVVQEYLETIYPNEIEIITL